MSTAHHISPELSAKAVELAAKSGVSSEQIIDGILRTGLDDWEREYRLIEKAAQQAERGEFASDADVQAVLNKYRPEA